MDENKNGEAEAEMAKAVNAFDALVIPSNWATNVESMIEAGRALKIFKSNISNGEFKKITRAKMGIDHSAVNKFMKLSEHPIISNPAYFSRLPPMWAFLYEASKLPPEVLKSKIEDGSIMSMDKYDVWELRNVKSAQDQSKIRVPNLLAVCKKIMMEETDHKSLAGLCRAHGIGIASYRMIKKILNLVDNPSITIKDQKDLEKALQNIDKTRNVRRYYLKVEPIINKVWGKNLGGTKKDDKSANKRVESFIDAVAVVRISCENLAELEVPYLSGDEIMRVSSDLIECRKYINLAMTKSRSEQHE